jgi:hypothetical protein
MSPAGFEPTILVVDGRQTYALDLSIYHFIFANTYYVSAHTTPYTIDTESPSRG